MLGSFALLNLSLAALVARVRPPRPVNRLLAVLFAANGAVALFQAIPVGVWGSDLVARVAGEVLDAPTLVVILLLPLYVPRRRLSGRTERFAWAGLAGAYALGVGLITAYNGSASWPYAGQLYVTLLFGTVVYVGVAVGALLMLDAYLGAPTPIAREQTRFVFAAYLLKAGAGFLVTLPLIRQQVPVAPELLPVYGLITGALGIALVATVIAIVASRFRARGLAGRPWTQDGFLLGFAALGLGFGTLATVPGLASTPGYQLEHFFVRPLLLMVGIVSFQLLEGDLRRERTLVALVAFAAALAVFVAGERTLELLGVDGGLAAGAAILAVLGAAVMTGGPLVRALGDQPAQWPDPRARIVYRAALEEALLGSGLQDASNARLLGQLRARLQLTDAEQALEEAAARAALKGPGAPPVSTPRDGEPLLGRYRVRRLLGEGGFGKAFLAEDERLGRLVVLKTTRAANAEDAKRAEREARLLARIRHPNIVTIHDVEARGGDTVLVLEYMEGGSLADQLARGPLPLAPALRIVDDVLAALEAAHAEGVVHRDIKPANILLTPEGRAKLADFGVAHQSGTGTAAGLSLGGAPVGSVQYMSPEQARDADLDARSDLYSVAVLLYEALTGRSYLDFTGRSEFDARLSILNDPPNLPAPGVPAALEPLLRAALAKDRARRPASAAAMRRAFVRAGVGDAKVARRRA